MVCVGLIGCKHAHPSVGGYLVVALMVIAIILGVRVVLYAIARCILSCRHDSSDDDDDEMEMRNISNAMAMHHNEQQWRSMMMQSSTLRDDDWQSKLVISAGSDHASYIAHPCPFRSATLTLE